MKNMTYLVCFILLSAMVSPLAGRDRALCSSLQQDGRSLRTTLSLNMFECTSSLFEAVSHGNSSLDFRFAVDSFCNDVEPRTCVAGVARLAKHCLKATDLVAFKVNQDNLRMIMAEVCLRRGVRVATLFGAVVHHTPSDTKYPLWQVCYLNLEHVINSNNLPGADSISKYKFLKHFKACVTTLGAGQTYVVNATVDLFNKIIQKFKCVHPLNRKREVYCYILGRDFLEQWMAF